MYSILHAVGLTSIRGTPWGNSPKHMHRAYALHRRQATAVLSRINCKDKLLKTVLLPKIIACNFQYYKPL